MSDPQPVAATAGEQDHSDPWVWAGEPTTPPGSDDLTTDELDSDEEVDSGFDTMADWRNCHASTRLLEAINAINPQRSKASDGTIGDRAHASRGSDHNPNDRGIVRARNLTRKGLDLPAIFEQLRRMGAAGDRRLTGGGYLILDRRITASDFSGWRVYTGSNPHISHGHVSFSRNVAGYDSNGPWVLGQAQPPPVGRPALRRGSTGEPVKEVQAMLGIAVTGVFDDATDAAARAFQRANGLDPDGIVGPATWKKLLEKDKDGGAAPSFPLPRGYYYGPLDGPRGSISGLHRNDRPEWREGLRRWQSRMKERGWKIGTDGQYGPQTKEVARRFQAEKRLGVDGLIGPGTWAAAWTAPVS